MERKIEAAEKIIDKGWGVKKVLGLSSPRPSSSALAFKRSSLYTSSLLPISALYLWDSGRDYFLLKNCKLKALQWGNSVTDDERLKFEYNLCSAMNDLSCALGIPLHSVSLGGQLSIAIGARGKGTALAHYEPTLKVINLTRKGGVGSLAHEWAHALDHHLKCKLGLIDKYFSHLTNSRVKYCSEIDGLKDWVSGWVTYKMKFKNRLIDFDFSTVERDKRYWLSAHEIFARSFESCLNMLLEEKNLDCPLLCDLKNQEPNTPCLLYTSPSPRDS